MKMFDLQLADRDINQIFAILYHVTPLAGPELERFNGSRIVALSLAWRKPNAMMLLAKVTALPEIATEARGGEVIDWCFDLLANRETELVMVEAALVVLTNLWRVDLVTVAWPTKRFAIRLFEVISPLLLTCHRTNLGIVEQGFSLFTECLAEGKEAVIQGKTIALASVLLFTYLERPRFVLVILGFLWSCADIGLLPQLRAVEKALPNALRAMERYIDEPLILEKCAGLALLMDHPKKFEYLQLAVRTSPNSEFLKSLCKRPEVDAFVRQQRQGLW
jgi:hypothetical protein